MKSSFLSPALPRFAIALTLVAACSTPISSRSGSGVPSSAEILWDSYGVPHIFASDRNGAARALGWAQMRNHGDLLLRLYAQARGRGAELLGEDYLEEDRWVWTMGIPPRATEWLNVQSPGMKAHLTAFVAGINGFASAHPDMVGDSVRAVLPVTETDVLAHQQRNLLSAFVTSRQKAQEDTRAWRERGSNAWAIAPSRSASGKAMLLANPHLPWADMFTWLEVHTGIPGMDLYGASIIGNPVINIAFNDHLGWTHTVNTQDGEDLYEITLEGAGYKWDGGVRPFDTERRLISVRPRAAGAQPRVDTLVIRRSVHGPVVADKPGKAIALRAVGLDMPFALEQWWNMGQARNLAAFENAIRPNQISGQNITYADRDGHIMYFYGGNSPVRGAGTRAQWEGIVPGETSSNLWTRVHGYDDMPKVVDPPSGYVQNANDPPWWSTFPVALDPARYPAYLATRSMSLRAQRSVAMLESDSSITFDELVSYKHSTRMLLADRILDDLLPLAAASGSSVVREAGDVLSRWDRSADNASRGTVLFVEWWRILGQTTRPGTSAWARPWSINAPRSTPDGLSSPEAAIAALETAVANVVRRFGAIDVAWGDVYRLRRDNVDLPSNGAQERHGAFRPIGYEADGPNRYRAVGGDSYVAAVEFSAPVRARSIIAVGNASRSGSPHRTDQLGLFSAKQLKPVWRARSEILANLELREGL
ncbi:MAG TPA: acylase [Gemmatimonadaceae bacterium]|nr:acylase [Gemmatimonadaceae bacterium]